MDVLSPQNDVEPDERISKLVNEFFERRQAGEDLSPERFASEHPGLAEELRPYLAGLALAEKVRTFGEEGLADEAAPAATELPAVPGYNLIEEIGRGGMGAVYRALQVSTKRIVALKVMLAGPFASPSARRRFEREVELAARFQHPAIVRVLESGEVAGQRYYAMDYVAGVRLNDYLSASLPDLRATLSLFVQLCEAVEYAHGHGVIHRDLKPANVLIDEERNPHILDFGLAKATDEPDTEEALTTRVSLAGQVVGTLFYLSPEQAAGTPDEIDVRTDVYALGVVLFEALTSSLPFDKAGRTSQVIQRILETTPIRPSSLSDRVDGELETIILKALEKEKERRYKSAREMAEDLRRYLAGEPILARRPSSLYVLRKKLRKHRLPVALAAAAVVLVLVGLFAESRSRQRALAVARQAALQCQRDLEGGTPTRSLGPAQALYERRPRPPEARLVWAQAQYRSDEMRDGVIQFLERELKRDRPSWACRALLAEIYRATGDAERADALQARAEREAPDTSEAWYLRSFATLDLQHALRCVEQAVQRQPSHTWAWQRLAYLRLQSGDPDGALRSADQLIELGEHPRQWILFKGRVLVRQGHLRQAIEQYTRVDAYLDRAHAYRRLKEYDNAAADYIRTLQAAGETTANVWHFYQRATPLWILGRTDEALADYERVRILLGRPFYSDARQYLILRELGRPREAQEVLDAALRDVERPSWLRRIFRCLDGQTTPEELVEAAAAGNNPETLCEAYYYAGEVCLLAGQPTEARRHFEQCVQTGVEFDPDTQLGTPMNEYELAQWRLEALPVLDTESQVPTSTPTSQP